MLICLVEPGSAPVKVILRVANSNDIEKREFTMTASRQSLGTPTVLTNKLK